MDRRKIEDHLTALARLSERIKMSQKFGQSLPTGTTAEWAEKMNEHLKAISEELGVTLKEPSAV